MINQVKWHYIVDFIDEGFLTNQIFLLSVLTPADDEHHVDKRGNKFKVPFVCGARNLGEALRRIAEGAAMIRTKGEAGTGKQKWPEFPTQYI